jgi:hypothetical protein
LFTTNQVIGLILLCAVPPCYAQPQPDPNLGKQIYRSGVLPSGKPVRGVVQNDVAIENSCLTCHRKSGLGGTEGGILVPPLTALFQPGEIRQADVFARLFEENQPISFRAGLWSKPARPAYTDETLATALRLGRDPAGREFSRTMPRYALSDYDVAHLSAYLKSLANATAPGVDATSIHFATVVSDGVDPDRRDAMLDVMNAYLRRKNENTQNELQKRESVAWYKEDFYRGHRKWILHRWELKGAPNTWAGQLAAYYRRQPVFALIGGMTARSWRPVSDFCERTETPCLFPETALPDLMPTGEHSLYFSRGLAGEAEALARYLATRPGSLVMQVYRDAELGRVPAEALRATLGVRSGLRIEDRIVPPGQALNAAWWDSVLPSESTRPNPTALRPTTLVLWLEDRDLDSISTRTDLPAIFLSQTLVQQPSILHFATDATYFCWPIALPGSPAPEEKRVRGWLLSRGVARRHERIQFNTYFAMSLLDCSLTRMVGNLSRDYLIETIERETETSINPGVFPRLSLGPGQRFASKGAYVVRLSRDGTVEPVSEWIVP